MSGTSGIEWTAASVEAFIRRFEACGVAKEEWTHQAHLVAGFWYVRKLGSTQALDELRLRIRRHNESVGTPNTDASGYHETLTRLYAEAIAAHLESHRELEFADSLRVMLGSRLADSSWPLSLYSREKLFSPEARATWVEPAS